LLTEASSPIQSPFPYHFTFIKMLKVYSAFVLLVLCWSSTALEDQHVNNKNIHVITDEASFSTLITGEKNVFVLLTTSEQYALRPNDEIFTYF
jgi:hypothetical protein